MRDCQISNDDAVHALRIGGVICEYDPFHNGHAHHLDAFRKRIAADFIICVMSGHFTQRGHASLLSKWARAEMALLCGADAVFELPAMFAVRDAERFARGGVSLLSSLGATHIGFGSESADLEALMAAATSGEDAESIRQGLQGGQTLARARGMTSFPNDILGIEYLRAIQYLASPLMPVCIRREGSGYHDGVLSDLPSATAVRRALREGREVRRGMPEAAYGVLKRCQEAGAYQLVDGLDTALLSMLRIADVEVLREIADVGEGLENRIKRAAQEAWDRESLMRIIKCKRYTSTRISRVLTQALLGITKQLATDHPHPGYARLLGFRRDAMPLLSALHSRAQVPMVTRVARFRSEGGAPFAVDMRAGDLWSLGLLEGSARVGSMDMTQPVVVV